MLQRKWTIALLAVLLGATAGCAFLNQAKQDTQAGLSTPAQTGETMLPADYAKIVSDAVGTVLPPAAGPAALVVTYVAAWIRGRKLRKGLPVSTNPSTGFLGLGIGLETVVQHLADVAHGVFEFFKPGSPAQTGYQAAAIGAIVAAAAPVVLAIPAVHNATSHNGPLLVALLGGTAAVIAAVQEQLSKVLPVTPVTPATSAATPAGVPAA